MKTQFLLKSRVILYFFLAMLAAVPSAMAQPTITSSANFGTQSIGGIQGIGLSATGGTPPYTWTIVTGALPPGLSIRTDLPSFLNSSYTAALMGVATTPATYNFKIRVTDSLAQISEQDCTIKISALVVKDSFSLSDAFKDVPYAHTLTAVRDGVAVPATWAINGSFPTGLSLNTATGEISGTPTVPGFYGLAVNVTQGGDTISRFGLNLTVFAVRITTAGNLPNATVGTSYATSIAASGGTGSKTFTGSGLPSGWSIDSSGNISSNGLVTANPGVFNVSITATDQGAVSYNRRMSLTVIGAPKQLPRIGVFGGTFLDSTIGWPANWSVNVSAGGTAPFTWSATGLPPGMSIRNVGDGDATPSASPADGEIWGAPTALGNYTPAITVTDADGATATSIIPMTVSALVMNNNQPGATWTRGVFSTERLRVIGGPSYPAALSPAPNGSTLYTVAIVDGTPPAGVNLNTVGPCAVLLEYCGTPTENISTNTRLRFTTTAGGVLLDSSYFFSVGGGASTIQINSNGNLGAITSNVAYSTTLNACCVANPLTWSIVSGALPTGLNLNASSGQISGTPTVNGAFTVLIKAADSTNAANFGTRQFFGGVVSNSISTSSTLPFGNVNTAYTTTLTAGFSGTWSVNPFNVLPPGLGLSAGGTLSGTPTFAGQFQFNVTVDAGINGIISKNFTLFIYPEGAFPPIAFTMSNQNYALGTVTTQLTGATGGSGTGYTYAYSPAATPVPGLRVQNGAPLPTNFSGGTTAGLIGVATTPGTYNTSIRVTDSAANFFDRAVTITVRPLHILSQFALPKAKINTFYTFTLTPTGGTSYSWSASNLPAGLSIGAVTGTISGTPTASGAFTPSITLTDLTTSTSVTIGYAITVNAFNVTTSGNLPLGTVGVAYPAQQLAAESNCGGTCTWTVSNGSLPTNFSLSSGGLLTNTNGSAIPSSTTNTTFTVQATGTAGTTQKAFTLQVVNSTLQLMQVTSPAATLYTALATGVSQQLVGSGGVPPYAWTLDSGSLPPGVVLQDPGDLIGGLLAPGAYLAGRAMQAGVFNFTLKATDSTGAFAKKTFAWTIVGLSSSYSSLPAAGGTITNGSPFSAQMLVLGGSATSGIGNYTFTNLTALPFGLSLDASTGVVSGTPTEQGNFNVSMQVVDSISLAKHIFNISLNIGGSTTVSFGQSASIGSVFQSSPGNNPNGNSFTVNLSLSGGTPPYTVTALTPLPPGFALLTGASTFQNAAANTWFLAGTPQTSGTFSFTLQVTDSLANVRQRTFTISIARFALGISLTLPDAAVGEAYSQTLLTYNNSGTVTWSLTPGQSLPAGLALAGNVISGTPTIANNSYTFTLDAVDPGEGIVKTTTFTLRVSSVRITNPAVIPVAAVIGAPFSYTFTATGGAVTWSSAGTLPDRFQFDQATGALTCNQVDNTGTFSFNVTATPAGGVAETRRFTLFSRHQNPTVLDFSYGSAALADATVGQIVVNNLTPSGGTPPYTWSVAGGSSLPPGLALVPAGSQGSPITSTFNPGTTALTGVPSTPGQYTFDLIVTDALAAQARRTFSLKVSPVGLILGTFKTAIANSVYAQQFLAVGGTGPYTFTTSPTNQLQDQLPPGLTLSSAGLLSGTPTSTGTYIFFLNIQDSLTNTFKRRVTLNVTNSSNLFVSNTNPPDAPVGVARRAIELSIQVLNSFTNASFTWTHVGGTMPPGMSIIRGEPWLDSDETMLAGQPTTPGTYVFTLRATDDGNNANWAEHTFTQRVAPMQLVAPPSEAFIAPDLPLAHVGVAYSTTLKMAGGATPYTFAPSPFNPFPAGLSLSAGGVISGTPQFIGQTVIQPIVTDNNGKVLAAQPMLLTVVPAAAPASLIMATDILNDTQETGVGAPYAFPLDLILRGGTPPFTWSLTGGTLPAGLALLPGSNGVSTYLGGVPTVSSGDDAVDVMLEVHDSGTQVLTIPLSIFVSDMVIAPDTLPPGKVGVPFMATITPSGGTPPYTFVPAPMSDFPPGLTLSPSGVLSGTPTSAGNFPIVLGVLDGDDHGVPHVYRLAIDNAAGEAPAVSLSPTPIQVLFTTGSANPAPIPVSINATSGTFPFGLSISGIPGASLSAGTGTAPGVSNLNLNMTGVGIGTYHGVLAVRATQSINLIDHVPVTLTVAAPPPCAYSLNPTSATGIASIGASGSFGVTAGIGCTWTAVPSQPWVTIDSGAAGSGSATIDYTVANNAGASARNATIDVHGQLFSISQFGSSCSFSITPSTISAPAGGGSANVNITPSVAGCPWTASGLSVTPTSGTGNGTVTITIPSNAGVPPAVLNATIAGQTLTVNQAGVNCTPAGLNPLEAASPSGGGPGSVSVTPVSGCSFGTVIGPSWVSVTSGGSGSSAGTLTYQVQPNSTTLQRSGTLTIGGRAFVITQEGVACSVTVDTSTLGSPYGPSAGLVGTIGVTSNGPNCSWVAGSGAGWATINPTSGSGLFTPVSVTVTSNTAVTTPRSTDLTVAGQTISIEQVGTTCTYALQSTTGSGPASGGVGNVGVIAPSVCTWTSVSNDPSWLSILSSGTSGNSSVLFSALPNIQATPRTGTMTIATKTYSFTQPAAACSYTLTPGSETLGFAGGTSSFGFSTGIGGCSPTPISYADWLINVHVVGSTVEYTALANPTVLSRQGTIQVGDKTFVVTEQPNSCGYSLNAYGSKYNQPGGANSVLGTATGLSCTPSVGTDQPGFIILGSVSGGPIFTLPFTVSPFTSLNSATRTGKITFGGQIHSVKQTSW